MICSVSVLPEARHSDDENRSFRGIAGDVLALNEVLGEDALDLIKEPEDFRLVIGQRRALQFRAD
jgi:hypothetical protein